MRAIGSIGGSILALALLAGAPDARAQAPLRIDLAPLATPAPAPPASMRPTTTDRAARRSFSAPQPAVVGRDRRLIDRNHARQDAISTLGVGLLTGFDPVEDAASAESADGKPSFKFRKQGHVARDLRRGYRAMGERLAGRVFDEPRGKRVVFDVAGKPGVGLEIPLR
jgi:hypothetical protein